MVMHLGCKFLSFCNGNIHISRTLFLGCASIIKMVFDCFVNRCFVLLDIYSTMLDTDFIFLSRKGVFHLNNVYLRLSNWILSLQNCNLN